MRFSVCVGSPGVLAARATREQKKKKKKKKKNFWYPGLASLQYMKESQLKVN